MDGCINETGVQHEWRTDGMKQQTMREVICSFRSYMLCVIVHSGHSKKEHVSALLYMPLSISNKINE